MIAPMIEKGIEVILGAKIDPVFGPFIVFGLGGIYAEAIKDVAFVEAPANKKMVVEMIKRLKSLGSSWLKVTSWLLQEDLYWPNSGRNK